MAFAGSLSAHVQVGHLVADRRGKGLQEGRQVDGRDLWVEGREVLLLLLGGGGVVVVSGLKVFERLGKLELLLGEVLVDELLVPVLNQLRLRLPCEVLWPAAPAAPLDQQPPQLDGPWPVMVADLLGVVGVVAVQSVLCRRAALSISTVGVCPLCCSLCPLRRLALPPSLGSDASLLLLNGRLDRRPFFERRRRPFARALQSVGHARVHKGGLDLEHDLLVRVAT